MLSESLIHIPIDTKICKLLSKILIDCGESYKIQVRYLKTINKKQDVSFTKSITSRRNPIPIQKPKTIFENFLADMKKHLLKLTR